MGSLKDRLKPWFARRAPWVIALYGALYTHLIKRPRYRRLGMAVFNELYDQDGWGETESVSGRGSTLAQTGVIRQALPAIVDQFAVATLLDIPCGDLNWISRVELGCDYIGADVVEGLVKRNRALYPGRRFEVLNIVSDPLPAVDLIFCRDLLFHFSFADAAAALANIKASGAKYLLATTNVGLARNREIATGEWRRLNLLRPPFSLAEPLLLIDEQSADPFGPDKHMGLWEIAAL